MELGILAINCGADAVYIGAGSFSARKEAHNSVADIKALAVHAHKYCAKVYVALNTLLSDDEVPAARQMLRELYDVGVDGVIIQDFGLLEVGLPPMPVIASTQTHNVDVAGVSFLERVGFSRAILARELDVNQIKDIRNQTENIELECFVHGALCVSYSGRCYLSYAKGKRSANRGQCAQPCRKKYVLENEATDGLAKGHLLSVKDLNRIDELFHLLDAGVTSFKIEGRLKGASYVANTVTAYRRALDAALAKRGERGCRDIFLHGAKTDLSKTFNRGYVVYFAVEDQKMANFTTPKMVGESLGKVCSVSNNTIVLESPRTLEGGDGLCFFDNDTLKGTGVQLQTQKGIVVRDATGIAVGTQLYRNHAHSFVQALENNRTERKVPIAIAVSWNETLELSAQDLRGNGATVSVAPPFESANNPKAQVQTWKKQLSKLGDSEFVCDVVQTNSPVLPFMRVSKINELRRQLLDDLREKRNEMMAAMRRVKAQTSGQSAVSGPVDAYTNVTNRFAAAFYEKHGAGEVVPAVESDAVLEKRGFAGVALMTSKYCLRRELGACLLQSEGASLKGPLYLRDADGRGERLCLKFDCKKCEMIVTLERPTDREDS